MKVIAGFGLRVASRSLCTTALFLCAALPIGAQEGPDGAAATLAPARPLAAQAPTEFGSGSNTTIIGAPSFRPRSDGTPGYSSVGYIYRAAGTDSAFWAPVPLPSGVLLTQLCIWYYNTSASPILAEWGAYGLGLDTESPIYEEFDQFDLVPAPGGYRQQCIFPDTFIQTLADLDDDLHPEWATYRVSIGFSTSDDTQRIGGVLLRWSRQVTPAPGNASFNDVDISDPAFQFIEAFSQAGITAGCSEAPPLYCPDATVTRRQMAVFFAKALGLYWPY